MNTLTLLDWDAESEREVHFLGWKSGSTRSTLFIQTQGRCRQITLKLPHHFELVFPSDPIPDLPITTIRRTALHQPACFASREEVREFVEHPPPISILDVSGKGWMRYTRHRWYLESDGAKDLHRRIHQTKQQQLAAYQEAKKEQKIISQLRTAKGEHAIGAMEKKLRSSTSKKRRILVARLEHTKAKWANWSEEKERSEAAAIEGRFTRSHTISGQKASKRMTFEADISDAAKSHPGLIEEIVIQAWAERYSIDLATMARDARAFKHWLEKWAINKPESVLYEGRKIPVPVNVLRLTPSQWDILLASVGFELRFKDGSRCWINGYVESDLLDAKSLAESEALLNQFNQDLSRPVDRLEIEATILNSKGEPVSRKWLKVLCERANVPFPPRTAGDLRKVKEWQLGRRKRKAERLRAANKKTTGARLPG